jgi:flagellar motor switch protein FliM
MIAATTDTLTADRLKQILAAIGSEPAAENDQLQVAELNWHQPSCFNTEQTANLNDFTNRLAVAITQKLAHFFGSDCTVTIASTSLHFAGELADQICALSAYYLPFGPDAQKHLGSLCMPAATALTWVSLMLGDTESQVDPNKTLSQLEESLLLDIASATVESLCVSVKDHFKLQPATAITSKLPIDLTGVDETCKISFEVKKNNSQASSQAYFIIPCASLAPVVGKTVQAQSALSPQETSKIILEHLQEIPAQIVARLTSTVLTFQEIMSLAPDDIVVLNKPVDDPIELLINGQTAFYGRLAQSEGNQAVIITEPPALPANNTQNNRKAA